jgi:malate/lactate dehydrogenase
MKIGIVGSGMVGSTSAFPDVVLRAAQNYSLDKLFAADTKKGCSEAAEKAGALTIEIIEKEED